MSRLMNAVSNLKEQEVELEEAQQAVKDAERAVMAAEELLEMVTADYNEAKQEAVAAAQEFIGKA